MRIEVRNKIFSDGLATARTCLPVDRAQRRLRCSTGSAYGGDRVAVQEEKIGETTSINDQCRCRNCMTTHKSDLEKVAIWVIIGSLVSSMVGSIDLWWLREQG